MGASGFLVASMVTGAASTAANAYSQSQAYKAQGAYQAAIASTNSKLAEMQADEAITVGNRNASKIESLTKRQTGSIRTALAGSGVDLSSGTAQQLIAASEQVGKEDIQTIKNNAMRAAWGYKTQSIQSTYEGKFASLTAKAKANDTILAGGINAVTGAETAYGNYLKRGPQ